MGTKDWDEILMIKFTLISIKKLGGCEIMRNTVVLDKIQECNFFCYQSTPPPLTKLGSCKIGQKKNVAFYLD
jgi:hypothetical protein